MKCIDRQLTGTFLVAVKLGEFIHRDEDLDAISTRRPVTTDIPSVALALEYREADAAARRLQLFYAGAHVATIHGQPATADDIARSVPYVLQKSDGTFFVQVVDDAPVWSENVFEARVMSFGIASVLQKKLEDVKLVQFDFSVDEKELQLTWGIDANN